MSNESKALEYAVMLETVAMSAVMKRDAAAELRRQHAEIESLRAQLDDEADALTVAYMHGYNKGKESQQAPVTQGEPVATVDAVAGAGPNDVSIRWRGGLTRVGEKLYTTPQQASEPVAVIDADGGGWFLNWKVPMHTLPLFTQLYTHPQQASEPMTENEVKNGEMAWALGSDDPPFFAGVRFAERHHNIKGKQ